jgi:LuxR family maltose regulon positive regulatory protein
VIEILLLQALACKTRGEMQAAPAPLERALELAEPERYVRTFVEEGPSMAALLHAAAKRGISPEYSQRLLTCFATGAVEARSRRNIVEPLSERELEVLRLLATDLDGPEIASQLMVSLNTMHPHEEHLRQAWREQPPGGGPSRRGAHPGASDLVALNHHINHHMW